MRNRVARVAMTTIATSKPKNSDMVADICGTILSTLYAARHLTCRGASSPSGPQKVPGPADQASQRSMHMYAAIVPRCSLTGQIGRYALGQGDLNVAPTPPFWLCGWVFGGRRPPNTHPHSQKGPLAGQSEGENDL